MNDRPAIQFDYSKRVVSLSNLEAMCDHVSSGMCHNYTISKVTKNRVYVNYSNPDEYGHDEPMTVVFPCFPGGWDSVSVVLDILDVKHDNWNGEGWQAFRPLLDCPVLWRDPQSGKWIEQAPVSK